MDLGAGSRLTDIEEKMVKAIEREWKRYEEDDGAPLPQSLVMLLEKAHKAIYARVGKNTGLTLEQMLANPEDALVELDKQKALIMKMLDQKRASEQKPGAPFLHAVP